MLYIHGKEFDTVEAKLEDALKRGLAYKNAGADYFYPVTMKLEQDIKKTVEQLQMLINILTILGIPELKKLNEMGVARVSLDPSFLKIAIKAFKDLAVKFHNFEGLSEITGNDITTDYLKKLVNKKHSINYTMNCNIF